MHLNLLCIHLFWNYELKNKSHVKWLDEEDSDCILKYDALQVHIYRYSDRDTIRQEINLILGEIIWKEGKINPSGKIFSIKNKLQAKIFIKQNLGQEK